MAGKRFLTLDPDRFPLVATEIPATRIVFSRFAADLVG
jgi:hypothetical protein